MIRQIVHCAWNVARAEINRTRVQGTPAGGGAALIHEQDTVCKQAYAIGKGATLAAPQPSDRRFSACEPSIAQTKLGGLAVK